MRYFCPFRKSLSIVMVSLVLLLSTLRGNAQMRQVYLDNVDSNEIYKTSFYTPSTGYVAFRDWVGYSSDTGRTFIKKYITNSNVNFNGNSVNLTFGFGINGVKAFNQNTFIVYGDYGLVPAILYTNNGGNSYNLIFHSQFAFVPNSSITDMVFPQNGNIGYAIDFDRILKTTNGGLSWNIIRTDAGSDYNYLESIDDNNLIAMSTKYATNKLLKTSNGGTSWQTVILPTIPTGKIYYAYFLSSSVGWVNMRDNNQNQYLFKTINEGTNWTLVNDIVATPFACSKFKFMDNNVGYALSGFTVLKTTNGGAVWEPLPRDNNYSYLGYRHNDLNVLNANQILAGGGHGFLELSTNAGGIPLPKAYFKIDTTNVYSPPYSVSLLNFSNPNYVFKWYVNNNLISTAYNTTFIHNLSNQVDSIKLIATLGSKSDTLLRNQYYIVPNLPSISTFYPHTGSTGTFITIIGSGFSNVNQIKFGGVNASSFNIISDTKITAIVATGASGTVSITNINGTFSKPGFIYYLPYTSMPPMINSITPQSGPIGTSVVISGNNFNGIPNNNEVFFGATKATVTSSTNTQINCIIPVGASFEEFSVLNKSTNQIGQSLKPFNVTFSDSSNFTPNSFTNAYTFTFPNNVYPRYFSAKDLDGDGKPDVVGHFFGDSLSIFRNVSTINNFVFEPPYKKNIPYPADVWTFDMNDIDGDGKPDLAISTNNYYVLVSRNLSSPGIILFDSLFSIPTLTGTHDIKIVDLDNDGKNDLVIASFDNSAVIIVRNTSNPGQFSFSQPINLPSGGNTRNVAIGDIDGDGKKDIVSYNINNGSGINNFSYYKNNSTAGNISFSAKVDIVVPNISSQGSEIRFADFNNDNKLDVFVLNDQSYNIYKNVSTSGSIAFLPVNTFNINGTGQGGNISNLSGGLKPDIISGNWSLGHFSLYKNSSQNGNINFEIGENIIDYNLPYHTNCTDFDLDGKIDVLASNSNGHSVKIFKNKFGLSINVPLCSNSSTTIVSDLTGTSYQWQEDRGNGYINVINNINATGGQANTLNLINIPFSWNGRKYRCLINNSKYSSQFILSISNIQVPTLLITSSSSIICEGYFVTFTATPSYYGTFDTYRWKVNGLIVPGVSSTLITSSLSNNSIVECMVSIDTSACTLSAISNQITINVIPILVPSINITGPSAVCQGTTNTYTASVTNGGTNPVFQWQLNGVNVGTNTSTYTTNTLINNAQLKCSLTSNATCATPQTVTSNLISVVVNFSLAPSISISSSASIICVGTSVMFTASPYNSGTTPTYQWQVNGIIVGINSQSFTAGNLNNNDQVRCTLTSNAPCASPLTVTSNTIIVSVTSSAIPSVNISSTGTNFCSSELATFTATPINSGPAPTYQWKVNGANAGTNSSTFTSSTLQNNAQVTVVMTSSLACASPTSATSNAITMSITPAPIANAGNDVSICTGSSIQLSGSGGTTYLWSPSAGLSNANIANPVASPATTTAYILIVTNGICTSRDTVVVTVAQPTTPSVSISTLSNNICNGSNITFTAVALNAGNNSSYQWQVNGINAGTNSATFTSNSLQNNAQVKVIVTSNGCTTTPVVTSNVINVNVTSLAQPIVSLNTNVLAVTNPDAAAAYTWQMFNNLVWANVVPTATGIAYTTTQAGEYRVKAVKAACSLFSASQVSGRTNTLDSTLYFIYLHPNPARGLITAYRIEPSQKWQTLDVINLQGQLVLPSKDIRGLRSVPIRVDNLLPGLYFVRLTNEDGRKLTYRFVKE